MRQTSEDVGKAIVDAMMGIEHANPDTLAGLFSSFDDANWTDKTKLSDERLKNLVEHMSELPVGNRNYSADVMGDAYEYLIKKFADMSKKNAGEFYTPRAVVKLMVQLLQPKSGESVYDPAAGTGGMLIEAIRNMDDEKASYGKIYGQEKEEFSRSPALTSSASAIRNRISKENGRIVLAASIALSVERLMFAFSARSSWDIPDFFRNAAITTPSSTKRSRLLKSSFVFTGAPTSFLCFYLNYIVKPPLSQHHKKCE